MIYYNVIKQIISISWFEVRRDYFHCPHFSTNLFITDRISTERNVSTWNTKLTALTLQVCVHCIQLQVSNCCSFSVRRYQRKNCKAKTEEKRMKNAERTLWKTVLTTLSEANENESLIVQGSSITHFHRTWTTTTLACPSSIITI